MFFSPLVYAQISLSNRIQHCLKSVCMRYTSPCALFQQSQRMR